MKRTVLDDAFPTVVRYTGVVLAAALVIAGILGQGGTNLASGGVLSLGMILYKTVAQAAKGANGENSDKS